MSTRFGPGDHTRLWEHLNDLDQDRLDATADTGWVNFAVESGTPNPCHYRVKAGVVYLRMGVTAATSLPANTARAMATLPPEAFPPPFSNYVLAAKGTSDRAGLAHVSAAGVITFKNLDPNTAVTSYYIAGCWPIYP